MICYILLQLLGFVIWFLCWCCGFADCSGWLGVLLVMFNFSFVVACWVVDCFVVWVCCLML